MENRARILIIEDMGNWRELWIDILISKDYQVQAVRSYSEAMHHLDLNSFNVIVVGTVSDDTIWLDSDATVFAEQIQNLGKLTSIIIIVDNTTSYISKRDSLRKLQRFNYIERYPSNGRNFNSEDFVRIVEQGVQQSYEANLERSQSHEVLFTSYYPKEERANTWCTLLVYIHLLSALDEVRRDAKRFKDQLHTPKEISSSSSTQIARGTDITIVPSCEGVTFNPPRMTIRWMEDFHRADFRFCADNSLADNAAKGNVAFFVGPVIIGTLNFAMLFNNENEAPLLDQEDSSTMYHKDKIFISYSHKDTDIARVFKKVHEATGYDVLIDIDDLRSGQEWNTKLMDMIDRADIFQLFWSENSKKSKYCKQEWKHALNRNREGFIRPIYWQIPLPKPPRELSKLHFEYVEIHDERI